MTNGPSPSRHAEDRGPDGPPTRKTVLLATCDSHPGFSASDSVLALALQDEGIDPIAAIWTSEDVAWSSASAVILRSTWDYHYRPSEFARWLDRLDRQQLVVWNSVRWAKATMIKTYLLELARLGWPVVPTTLMTAGSVVSPAEFEGAPSAVVVKPLIGASAYRNFVVRAGASLSVESDVLVQPFLEEIAAGEWSVIAIDGEITHSVLKTPASGDHRVQRDHGGSATVGTPPTAVVQLADEIVRRYLTPDVLYARIDIVMTGRGPLLMEVELIEPELFFDLEPAPARTMARTVARRLRGAE
jgi:glutathione synthase/RimK-type ligase-like ATP-grasp enzyme